MIWLAGIAVALLAVITITCLLIHAKLSDISSTLNTLSSMRFIAQEVCETSRKTLETLREIERHTAMAASPQYEAEHVRRNDPYQALHRD